MSTSPPAAVQGRPTLRHPLDPDPVRSTKAGAVFACGLMAALTGLLLGGVVPATVALLLARQARRQAYASGGFLTGAVWVARGERLAWAGLALAALALAVVLVAGLLQAAGGPAGHDFGPEFD